MPQFSRIGHRLLVAVGAVVVAGLFAVILVYADRQEKSIRSQNEFMLLKVTEGAAEGLSAIMLRGYAGIAPQFADRLKRVSDVVDYRVLRTDGTEAFRDNLTIDRVNAHLGEEKFKRHPGDASADRVLPAALPQLERLRSTRQPVIFYASGSDGDRLVTVLQPIHGADACAECHERGEELRGLVKLTTSLGTVDEDIAATWRASALVIVVGLAAIFAAVWFIAHRSVVSPIESVTRAMSIAASGDLSVSVPVTGQDEIGRIAEAFNQMSGELRRLMSGLRDERNKLTTIILGAKEGIVVTDHAQRVVLVNPAAERLLGKSQARVSEEGFLALLDDPGWMRARIEANPDRPAPRQIAYNGRTLAVQVSTIRKSTGGIIGTAALIRDVTEETRLAAELRRRAETDAMTGLYNRRYFDEALARELHRWKRYPGAFSLLLLDVDHFKRFNDNHGHDCGDRVLKAIGKRMLELPDASSIPCRYGGEELALLLPDCGAESALGLAESLRADIASLEVDGLRVTVSIGVASCPPLEAAEPEAVLKAADAALYRAKQQGRNRVSAAWTAAAAAATG